MWGLERGNWIKKRINLSNLWGNKILNIDLLYIDHHYFSFLHNLLKWHGMFCPGMFCPAPIKTLSVWGLERGNWIKKRINLSDLWGNKILNIDLLYIDHHYFSFLHNLLK